VRQQYAQALVDGGNPALALLIYTALADDPYALPHFRREAEGGRGRCYKELFLSCTHPERRRAYLDAAIATYLATFRQHRLTYHGVNAAACLARAHAEGYEPDDRRARRVAAEVLDALREAPQDMWSHPTACEALLALGETEQALQSAEAFVAAKPGAFHLASLVRQLVKVWRLTTDREPGSDLLPLLRSALLQQTGGRVVVEPHDVSSKRLAALSTDQDLERVLSDTRFKNLQWYRNGLARCRAVARILNDTRDPIGTGFLLRGADLHPDLPALVLVTNEHVVPAQLGLAKVRAVFHGAEVTGRRRPPEIEFGRRCWDQPSDGQRLDATILDVVGGPGKVEPLPLAEPLRGAPAVDQRAYVIGHPGGMDQPQFSLQDNLLLGFDSEVLRYRSPTEEGSSGSPVFDDDWGLLGLHRRYVENRPPLDGRAGTESANEGVRIDAVRARLGIHPPR
jgi:hypothetical protein